MAKGKIGFFDSGVGGLVLMRACARALPDYDMVYVGDTLHVPYGPRSAGAIYNFTESAMRFLFDQGCHLIIVACNTASASSLRRLQQHFLPQQPQDGRRILGVIVPTLEAATDGAYKRIGLIGTSFTVRSGTYAQELEKIDPAIRLFAREAPLLVPLIEQDGLQYAAPVLADYLAPLVAEGIDSLILGCTHYPLLKPLLHEILPGDVALISQDEVVPPKLKDYLRRHPEMDAQLSRGGRMRICLTDRTEFYETLVARLFDGRVDAIEDITL